MFLYILPSVTLVYCLLFELFQLLREERAKEAENRLIMSRYHVMKFNLIIHNFPEFGGPGSPESQAESIMQVEHFLYVILGMQNAHKIRIRTAYRLMHHRNNPKPLMFKLARMSDKMDVLVNLKALKGYNRGRERSVYVVEQLPYEFDFQRKKLLPSYLSAKNAGLKPKWRVDSLNAQYYYKIGSDCYYADT